VGAFDKFSMSYSKQSSLIDKGNGVGPSSSLFELIFGQVSWSNSLAGEVETSEASGVTPTFCNNKNFVELIMH
jgi:hypothetical protein